MKIGVIRVLTLEDSKQIDQHGNLIENHFPELSTTSECIKNQPQGIHDKESKKEAIPKVKKLAVKFQRQEDIEAVFISCTEDPGIHEIKKELNIPVIGAGNSLARISSVITSSLGLLTISSEPPEPLQNTLGKTIKHSVRVANETLDLESKKSYQTAVDSLKEFERQGCGAIALGCTGFSTVGMAKKLGNETQLPLIDPVIAGGSVLDNLVYSKEVKLD